MLQKFVQSLPQHCRLPWHYHALQNNMGLENIKVDYEIQDKGEFQGAYYGQLVSNVKPDTINILTSDTLKKCTTYNFEKKKNAPVYTENTSADRYDPFMQIHGFKAIVAEAAGGKNLYVFCKISRIVVENSVRFTFRVDVYGIVRRSGEGNLCPFNALNG